MFFHLKIGVSSTLCKYMLLPYLKEFIKQNPHISISITCQSTNDTLKLLEDNKIDIGLIGRPDSLKNIQFDFVHIGSLKDARKIVEQMDLFAIPVENTDSILNQLNEKMDCKCFMKASDLLKKEDKAD